MRLAGSLVVLVLLAPLAAYAQAAPEPSAGAPGAPAASAPAAPATSPQPSPQPSPSPSPSLGLYLRLGLGPAYHSLYRTERATGLELESRLSGPALDGQLLVGGSIGNELAAGAQLSALFLAGGQTLRRESKTGTAGSVPTTEIPSPRAQALIVGAFFDFFPDKLGGFHCQGAAGYAHLSSLDAVNRGNGYHGVGLSGGLGFDASLGAGWGLGVLGQGELLGFQTTDDQSRNPAVPAVPAGTTPIHISVTMVAASLLVTLSHR